MKSRTLTEVHQSPGRKPLQLSRSLDSFRRAALPFMTRLPFFLMTFVQNSCRRVGDRSSPIRRFEFKIQYSKAYFTASASVTFSRPLSGLNDFIRSSIETGQKTFFHEHPRSQNP